MNLNMNKDTYDVLCYILKYGQPDLITITKNPNWDGLKKELFDNPFNQHDIVARGFHLKLKKLIHLIICGLCFLASGRSKVCHYTHILLWLVEKKKTN